MPFVSSITQAPITIRSDRLVNTIIQNSWTITNPATENIGWGEMWETSQSPNTILAWEQPVNVELVGFAANHYDYDPINVQIDIMTRNAQQVPFPPELEAMVFHVEKIITDNILAGVQPAGYHSMILLGHQYIRNPNVTDKQLCAVFVKLKVRMNHVP
jgi:hypothetical protein